jgi:hypothetical protein
MNYEIQDDKGVLFKGTPMEIMYIWGSNYYNDEFFEKTYGHLNRNPKHIIKEWEGRLRVVAIIDEADRGPGKHQPLM